MKSALRSLVVVTIIVLIGFGIAWLYMKSKASNQPPRKPIATPFFDGAEKPLVFARVNDLEPAQIRILNPRLAYWVDTQVTKDGKVISLADRELPNPNYSPESPDRSPETKLKNLSCRYLSWADVQKIKPGARLLEELLLDNPNRRFILNVVDYSPGADVVLSETVSRLKADERIILQSEQDGLLSDLRKLEPMWLYGTSRAQVVQTLWLSTIGLQGIAPLKGDVLITSLNASETNQKTRLLTPELVAEARRRSMKVLVGPVTKSEADEVIQLGVDGIITSQPQEFGFPQL